jgi:hypothetical protein
MAAKRRRIVWSPAALLQLDAAFEEQHALVSRAVVVAHPDFPLVPDERLPEPEARLLRDRLRHEHRLGIAEQVEVRVLLEHPVHFGEQLPESRVRDIPPAIRGTPKIEVTSAIDDEGWFTLAATDLDSERQQPVSVDGALPGPMTQADIERLAAVQVEPVEPTDR